MPGGTRVAGEGGFLTMQRYPVLTGGDAEAVMVEARRIRG